MRGLGHGIKWCEGLIRRRYRLAARLGLDGPSFLAGSVLGGGTLIGLPWFRARLADAMERAPEVWCCGTGVGRCGWTHRAIPDLSGWKGLLERFKGVGVRGPLSKAQLDALGIGGVEICGDLALALTRDELCEPIDPPTLAVNVSLPLDSNDEVDGEVLMDALVRLAKRRHQSGWRILPLVMDKADVAPVNAFCRRVAIDRAEIVHSGPVATIEELSRCSALIGVRLHSAVLAACVGVPPILLGYREKCLDFMMSMGLEDRNIGMTQVSGRRLVGRMEELLASPEELHDMRRAILAKAQHWANVQKRFVDKMVAPEPVPEPVSGASG